MRGAFFGFRNVRILHGLKPAPPFVFLIGILFLLASTADARVNTGGANAAEILRIGIGARMPAMGEAAVAGAKGVDSLRYNPGGLGMTDRREGELSYHDVVLDVGMGSLTYASPWRRHGRDGAFAVGLTYIDYGEAKRTTVADQTGSGGSTFGGSDFVLSAAYGTKLRDALGVGVAGRMLSSSIDNANATAFSIDVGVQWRPRDRLTVGAAVQNLGTGLKFFSAKEDLPLTIRGGVSYQINPGRWTASADLEKTQDDDVTLHLGTEYRITDAIALRAGYDGANRSDRGITAGFGITEGNFTLDYAYVPFGDFGANHRLALRYDMGADAPMEMEGQSSTPFEASVVQPEPAIAVIEPMPELLDAEDAGDRVAQKSAPSTSLVELIEPLPEIMEAKDDYTAGETGASGTPVAPSLTRTGDTRASAMPARQSPEEVLESQPVPEPDFGNGIVGSLLRSGYRATKAGKDDEAAAFYGATLAFDPENTRALYNSATIHYRLKNYNDAQHYYERLLDLTPDDAEAWYYLGNSLKNLGMTVEAATAWKQALSIDPSNVAAARALAQRDSSR